MSLQLRSGDDDEVNASINTTPLVDVMLVLLIIFLITIPVVTQTVPLSLPKESNKPRQTRPENIEISIDRAGRVYWNAQLLGSHDALLERLKAEGVKNPQPEIQVRGDEKVRYEAVGRVLHACQRAGLTQVGFVTEPAPRS